MCVCVFVSMKCYFSSGPNLIVDLILIDGHTWFFFLLLSQFIPVLLLVCLFGWFIFLLCFLIAY